MNNKILFATDGSDKSKQSLKHLINFAKKYNSEVTLFFAFTVPFDSTMGTAMNYSHLSLIRESYMDYGNELLDGIKKELKDNQIEKIKHIVLEAEAGNSIISYSEDNNIDLIIMGSRGLGTIKSLVMGSVSNYVVHHANCPVLVSH